MARQVTVPGRTGRSARVPSLAEYVQESRAELRKVTWPTREETIQLTTAVIVMTVSVAAFLGIIDQILTSLVGPLTGIK